MGERRAPIAAMTLLAKVAGGICLGALLFGVTDAFAACRPVGPIDRIEINRQALASLQIWGVDRQLVFDTLKVISTFETEGCWGGASGDFDDQIVSAGALQWNFGKGSLQRALQNYRTRMGDQFDGAIAQLMRTTNSVVFSKDCLEYARREACRRRIYGSARGQDLPAVYKEEFDNLFNSDDMIQIQMDGFVGLVQGVRDDIKRLFADRPVTVRRLAWAVDSKVQMENPFPDNALIARVREKWEKVVENEGEAGQKRRLLALVDWYQGLARSVDQDGVRNDVEYNAKTWKDIVEKGVDAETAELLNFTYVVSRTLSGKNGLYQADAFQRRAKVALGKGSVHGHR